MWFNTRSLQENIKIMADTQATMVQVMEEFKKQLDKVKERLDKLENPNQ